MLHKCLEFGNPKNNCIDIIVIVYSQTGFADQCKGLNHGSECNLPGSEEQNDAKAQLLFRASLTDLQPFSTEL